MRNDCENKYNCELLDSWFYLGGDCPCDDCKLYEAYSQ